MNIIKQFSLLVLLLFFSANVSAQKSKTDNRAKEMVTELNTKLGDAKLSTDQEQKVLAIYIEKLAEVKQARKELTEEVAQKEKIKEINKKFAKKINEEILSTEQKAAIKLYNEKNKK